MSGCFGMAPGGGRTSKAVGPSLPDSFAALPNSRGLQAARRTGASAMLLMLAKARPYCASVLVTIETYSVSFVANKLVCRCGAGLPLEILNERRKIY